MPEIYWTSHSRYSDLCSWRDDFRWRRLRSATSCLVSTVGGGDDVNFSDSNFYTDHNTVFFCIYDTTKFEDSLSTMFIGLNNLLLHMISTWKLILFPTLFPLYIKLSLPKCWCKKNALSVKWKPILIFFSRIPPYVS